MFILGLYDGSLMDLGFDLRTMLSLDQTIRLVVLINTEVFFFHYHVCFSSKQNKQKKQSSAFRPECSDFQFSICSNIYILVYC